jgi:Asp-tRNA(Asn)/Glu-tRNA(Gln) amidotransferase A subunit family amidase
MAPLYWTAIYKAATSQAKALEPCRAMRQMCRAFSARWRRSMLADAEVPMLPRTHALRLSLRRWYDDKRMGPDCCFTSPFNASGSPAISVPMSWSKDGLPIGVQFVGRDCDEATLIRIAAQIEKARPWLDKRPPICS